MSSKLKCIITSFVLVLVFNEISVNGQGRYLTQGFNDCFRMCLTRFIGDRGLRTSCIDKCKKIEKQNKTNSDLDTTTNKGEDQDEQVQNSSSTTAPIEELNADSNSNSNSEDSEEESDEEEVTTSIRNYGSVDYMANEESQIEQVVEDNTPEIIMPEFKAIPQPDHCGFKSTKDMKKKKLIGGLGLGRVVGGTDADEHEFPWIVSIQYFKNSNKDMSVHFCGGAIITKNVIITAAHCMDRFVGKESALVFKLGVNTPNSESEQVIKATKVIVHEGWDSSRQINDISLIKVHPDIKFTTTEGGKYTVNALCLPDSQTEPDGDAVLAGWGEQAFKTGVAAEYLQKVTVPFVDRDQCHKIYKNYLSRIAPDSKVEVLKTHICAGGKGGEDACRGDSGGALIHSKGRQAFHIGIVSFSVPCAIKDLPTIYTNVIFYMNWIHKNIFHTKSH